MQIIGLAGPARVGKNVISDYLVKQYGYVRYAFADPLYREVAEAFGIGADYLEWLKAHHKEDLRPELALTKCEDDKFVHIMAGMSGRWPEHDDSWKEIQRDRSLRMILQVWGTEYRRAQNPQYWIEQADLFLEAYLQTLERIVTEEEFDAEVEHLKSIGSENPESDALPVGTVYYDSHPGLVIEGVRFDNEVDWIRGLNGRIWHIEREDAPSIGEAISHTSATELEKRTGDKLILNNGSIADLHTGVTLALQGNDIVNTGGNNE